MTADIVLVGGSGKIGRALASSLAADGVDVLVLTRDVDRARARGSSGRLEAWSSDRIDDLAATLAGCRAVVNLAGVPVGPRPWWIPGRRRAIRESRVATTRSIVEAIRRLGPEDRPGVLVSASGTDGYEGRDVEPADESTSFGHGFLAEVCRAWEGEARQAVTLGVRVGIVRIGFVLAHGAPALGIYALPFRMRLGGPIGSGRQWMSWIHLDDVVALLRMAIDDERIIGAINAVSPQPAREGDVATAIGRALGRRSWLSIPPTLIRFAMGESAVLPLGSRRVVPRRALELGYRFRWTDLDPAIAEVLAPMASRDQIG